MLRLCFRINLCVIDYGLLEFPYIQVILIIISRFPYSKISMFFISLLFHFFLDFLIKINEIDFETNFKFF